MKKKKIITIILISLLFTILAGVAGVYFYYGYTHRNEFFKGVVINGTNVSGMTVEEVEKQIAEKAENFHLTVNSKDGKSVDIGKDDIAYRYVSDGSVQKYFDQQVWWQWIKGYMKDGNASYEVSVSVTYDKEMLKSLMNSWDFMQPANMIEPVDSILAYENNQYLVTDHVDGTKINGDLLYEALTAAVDNTQESINAADTGAYYLPAVTKDNPLLNENANTLNSQANANIVHNLPDGSTKTINKDVLLTWMSQDEGGKYYRDDAVFNQKISEYVAELADAVKALNSNDITFTGAGGVSHTVYSYINLGWKVNAEQETAQLAQEVFANQSTAREPVYSSSRSTENGGIGYTFVEIDLSSQRLWYHEGGDVVLETDIVSGTYNDKSRRTPGGIYKLNYKERNRVLRGAIQSDGKPEYETPVSYWMPFNGGIGMHDADWRSSFGGSIYRDGGSHGCINMPPSKAASLYGMISSGCIVVCYY